MFEAVLTLIVSIVLLAFYLQAVCHKLLRHRFTPEFYKAIVNNNCLEFPLIRKGVEEFGSPGEYGRLRVALKCDFVIITHLLKRAYRLDHCFTLADRLMMFYFRLLFASLVTRHRLRLPETSTVMKLTVVLEYLANVLGQRINRLRFGNLAASGGLSDSLHPGVGAE